jgi:tartrate-resistant acid phosphatase type 5
MKNLSRRRALKTLFCSSAVMALNLQARRAQAEIAKDGLHFLAIGDFGTGAADQRAVSKAMQDFVAKNSLKSEAMLLLGDNFYGPTKDGLTVDSKRWRTDIEEMYPASIFPEPQYAVLGNHDYHDNAGGQDVQLAYSKKAGVRWKMPAKWYRQDFGGVLTVLFLDSNLPAVSGAKDKKTGKSRASLTADEAKEQMAWLKAELAKPRAPFTLVVAHHPIYSNGDHGDTKALVAEWEPLLQEHKIHAYLCGHDHDLQHLEVEGKFTSHIISGGGGAKTRKLEHPERKMPYGKDVHGFTHITVKADALTFAHHGVDGALLHRFTKRLDGKVEIG